MFCEKQTAYLKGYSRQLNENLLKEDTDKYAFKFLGPWVNYCDFLVKMLWLHNSALSLSLYNTTKAKERGMKISLKPYI